MLSCKDACENATEYLDGEMTLPQRLSMRFHLMLCKQCRRFFRHFNIANGAAAQLSNAPEPSDAEIDALVEKLANAHEASR